MEVTNLTAADLADDQLDRELELEQDTHEYVEILLMGDLFGS